MGRKSGGAGFHRRSNLFTNVVMHQMGGRDLAAELEICRAGAKVILTSGNHKEAVFEQGLPGENVSYLQKPFVLDGLACNVHEVLDS